MKLIDLHADTITALYYDMSNFNKACEYTQDKVFCGLNKNNLHIDLEKLKQADSLAQFFVLWLNLDNCIKYNVTPWNQFIKLYNQLNKQIALNNNQISLVQNNQELFLANQQNKIGAFACVEEGAFITDIAQLATVYIMGIKYITLVWNYESHIGVPSCIDQTRGLTAFGKQMVIEMQRLGIIVDVSHLSDAGVRDVLEITTKAVIASHSNVRALCNHWRNLPDDLIIGIAKTGGVIGINCVPFFLDEHNPNIKIAKMIEHIQYIYNLVGIDAIAIGNDFDGFMSKEPEKDDIQTIADMSKLALELSKAGFTELEIEKIFSLNILRVMNN